MKSAYRALWNNNKVAERVKNVRRHSFIWDVPNSYKYSELLMAIVFLALISHWQCLLSFADAWWHPSEAIYTDSCLSWNIANSSLQVLQFKILYLTIQFNFNSLNINSHSVVVHCIKYGVCFCFLCVSENLFIEFQDFTSFWTFFAISLSSIISETLFKRDFFVLFLALWKQIRTMPTKRK